MAKVLWHLFTGEYPPVPGGVSDYCHLIAGGLASAGAEVHIWTGPADEPAPEIAGVTVHRVAGRWARTDLERIDAELDRFAEPRRLCIQYTPNAFGFKGMNLGFCRWLRRRRAGGDDVQVLLHEAVFPWELCRRPKLFVLAAATRLMLREVVAASTKIYVTIPEWGVIAQRHGARSRPIVPLPVPNNIPVVNDPAAVVAVRAREPLAGRTIVGHFGSYGGWIREQMLSLVPRLLEGHPERAALLLGRGSERVADEVIEANPGLADRVIGAGGLEPEAASIHIQACDVFVQPFPDGITGRRTSAMACLAHQRALATTTGHLTEPFWADSGVRIAPVGDPEALVRAASDLLDDPGSRAGHAARALEFYNRHFALERTVEKMMDGTTNHS